MKRVKSIQKVLLISLVGLFLSLVPCTLPAAEKIIIQNIQYWSYPDYTRIVIEVSDKADFAQNRLANPDRLYFDIKNSVLKKEVQKSIAVDNGMLKSVRAGQYNDSTSRIVLDLGKVTEHKVFTLDDPKRIVVDIFGEKVISVKKRIVLDPGHGGHDPGAVGPKNLYEKDVVLDIALKLKKLLSNDSSLEIFLTRETDIFIPLEQRTAIANSKNADLFISIHANASTRRDARGIETYFLNWSNDEEAMKVAARENRISLNKMKQLNEERDVLDFMLADLRRTDKREESLQLAHSIQRSMVRGLNQEYSHIVDHGVKQALFYVLLGAQMSSVLVEVSFISNPLEEKLLSSDSYRKSIASSIASGITKYMSSSPEGQTVANARSSISSRD